MNSKLVNLSILVVFLCYSFVPEVNAIRCYTCDSRTDKKCLTGGISGSEDTCPAFVKSCLKIYGKVNSDEYVARSCNLVNQCAVTGLSTVLGTSTFQVDCLDCTNDLCNGSDSLLKSKQYGLLGLVAAFLFKQLLF